MHLFRCLVPKLECSRFVLLFSGKSLIPSFASFAVPYSISCTVSYFTVLRSFSLKIFSQALVRCSMPVRLHASSKNRVHLGSLKWQIRSLFMVPGSAVASALWQAANANPISSVSSISKPGRTWKISL